MINDQGQSASQAHLGRLAAALTARNYQADMRVPPGSPPYLDVRNPHASVLSERVYVQADAYWYSWCERIAGCDQPDAAAAALARVLRIANTY